jgi:Ca2+-binding RTX toxin-like protein
VSDRSTTDDRYRECHDLFVAERDGGDVTKITDCEVASRPAWSPRGTEIAFTRWFEPHDYLAIVSADGGGKRILSDVGQIEGWKEGDSAPSWSPDGAKIAFAFRRDGRRDIYVMESDGSGQRPVVTGVTTDTNPAWSPDRHEIALERWGTPSAPRSGPWIYITDGEGTRTHFVTAGEDPDWQPLGNINLLFGTLGADVVWGTDGPDEIRTGAMNDAVYARHGDDVVYGGTGNDRLRGGADEDSLYGGHAGDILHGGPGEDVLVGGPGNDRVVAVDGARDTILCGSGRDTVVADALDVVATDCEAVTTR